MKISTKARYGLRSLLDLALHDKGTPIGVKEIAKRQRVSEKYLEQLLLHLKKAGYVRSIHGAKGGYHLAKDPAAIPLRGVVEALEGSLSLVDCVLNPGVCPESKSCVSRELWCRIAGAIGKELDGLTLKQMIEWQEEKKGDGLGMYDI